jgi:hypothetical protein
MERNKVLVLVNRQLDAEDQLLDRLEKICACFTANALEAVSDNSSTPQLQLLESLLEEFKSDISNKVKARQATLEMMKRVEPDGQETSIRRFIQMSDEPWRTQLEQKRISIINRIYELKVQLAGDSAAVFYSYDFYRRVVNGLIGSSVQETEYLNDGKSMNGNSGILYEKAC